MAGLSKQIAQVEPAPKDLQAILAKLTEEVDCVKDMISTNDNLLQNKEKKSHKRKLFKKDDEDLHKDLGF